MDFCCCYDACKNFEYLCFLVDFLSLCFILLEELNLYLTGTFVYCRSYFAFSYGVLKCLDTFSPCTINSNISNAILFRGGDARCAVMLRDI